MFLHWQRGIGLAVLGVVWLLDPSAARAWEKKRVTVDGGVMVRFNVRVTPAPAAPSAPWYTYFPYDPHIHGPGPGFPNWPKQFPPPNGIPDSMSRQPASPPNLMAEPPLLDGQRGVEQTSYLAKAIPSYWYGR
jgi:hypothetical protein